MSAQSDANNKPDVTQVFKILGIDWHVVIGFIGIFGTIVAFLYNLQVNSDLDRTAILELKSQVVNVNTEYHGINSHLDTIERSIGRLEGLVNRYGNNGIK